MRPLNRKWNKEDGMFSTHCGETHTQNSQIIRSPNGQMAQHNTLTWQDGKTRNGKARNSLTTQHSGHGNRQHGSKTHCSGDAVRDGETTSPSPKKRRKPCAWNVFCRCHKNAFTRSGMPDMRTLAEKFRRLSDDQRQELQNEASRIQLSSGEHSLPETHEVSSGTPIANHVICLR